VKCIFNSKLTRNNLPVSNKEEEISLKTEKSGTIATYEKDTKVSLKQQNTVTLVIVCGL